MKVWLLFDHADFAGVFGSFEAAVASIPAGRQMEDFRIEEYAVVGLTKDGEIA